MRHSIEDSVLEPLFVINKIAKTYSEESKKAYKNGLKVDAKYLSIRKDAIYDYKSWILEELYNEGHVDQCMLHTINGKEFYCFYMGDYSFHTPSNEISTIIETDKEADITSNFNSDSVDKERLPLSEREALTKLQERFVSANNFIGQYILSTNISSRETGWKYLDGFIGVGDYVPISEVEQQTMTEFLFDQGDLFNTVKKGTLQIIDKNAKLSEPYGIGDRVRPLPVYDVLLLDEDKTLNDIRQRRILDEWYVNLGGTEEVMTVERISSEAWEEYILKRIEEYPNLNSGETLIFDNGEKATIDNIYTNDLVLIFFVLDWDSHDYNDHFTLDEFWSDVKYIKNQNKKIKPEKSLSEIEV